MKEEKKTTSILKYIVIVLVLMFLAVVFFSVFPFLVENSSTNSQEAGQEAQTLSESVAPLDESFAVDFPGQSEESTLELGGVKIKQYEYVGDDMLYFVKIGKFEEKTEDLFKTKPESVDVFLSNFPDNLFTAEEKNPTVLLSEKKMFFDNYPGIEYEYKATISDEIFHRKGFIFMRNGETLQLSVVYSEKATKDAVAKYDAFKKSFRLKK